MLHFIVTFNLAAQKLYTNILQDLFETGKTHNEISTALQCMGIEPGHHCLFCVMFCVPFWDTAAISVVSFFCLWQGYSQILKVYKEIFQRFKGPFIIVSQVTSHNSIMFKTKCAFQ